MKRVLNILNGNKQGFTLIEVLVVLAILGAISGVMAMTIGMVRNTTGESTAQNLMMSQVNQAASWIAMDIQSADIVTQTGTSGLVLCTITRYVYNGSVMTTQDIVYEVTNPGHILLRKVGGSDGTPVAQFISFPGDANYTTVKPDLISPNTYIIRLRCIYSNGETYQQQFKVLQRSPP